MRRTTFGITSLAVLAVFAGGCDKDAGPLETVKVPRAAVATPSETAPEGVPTFAADVAPIIYEHCATCHRPADAAPFPLITYDDVKERAEQIADVAAEREMPPWLPAAEHGGFLAPRRLTDEQIATLREWADTGMHQGDPQQAPTRPARGWRLGTPDLLVGLSTPYELPAGDTPVVRNFVIPLNVATQQVVRAIEFHPGDSTAVRQAILFIDRTETSRDRDDGAGFASPVLDEWEYPDGHFLAWSSGDAAVEGADGTGWRLLEGSDLVLQLHMVPGNETRIVDPEVAFYFTEDEPTFNFFTLTLGHDNVAIPPNSEAFVFEDTWSPPVDLRTLSVYPMPGPHATRFEAWADAPGGTRTWFVDIPRWDPRWQEEYRLARNDTLPAGTTLTVRVTYDNPGDTVLHEPGAMITQVVTKTKADQAQLRDGSIANTWEHRLRDREQALAEMPDDGTALLRVGEALRRLGRYEDALVPLGTAVAMDGSNPDVRDELGVVHQLRRFHGQAIPQFETALSLDPEHVAARYHLANSLYASGHHDDAIREYHKVIELDPRHVSAYFNLALVHRSKVQTLEAIENLEKALALRPDHAKAHYAIGQLYYHRRRYEDAARHLHTLTVYNPDFVGGHFYLGMAYINLENEDGAIREFRETLRLEPDHPEALRRLYDLTGEEGYVPAPKFEDIRRLPSGK